MIQNIFIIVFALTLLVAVDATYKLIRVRAACIAWKKIATEQAAILTDSKRVILKMLHNPDWRPSQEILDDAAKVEAGLL